MKNEESNKSEEIYCRYCGRDVSGELSYYFPTLDKRLCTSCRGKHKLLYKLLKSDEYLAQEKKRNKSPKFLAPRLFDETCCCCGRELGKGQLYRVFPYIYRSMCYECVKNYRWYYERMSEANDNECFARAKSEEPVFCDDCGMRIGKNEVYLNLITTGKNLCECCNNYDELRDKLQKEQTKIRIMNTCFRFKLFHEMKKEESAMKIIATRKVPVDKEVETDKLTKLNVGDVVKVIIGGKAYNARIVGTDFYDITLTADVRQEVAKTWDVLGYDSFEDMIDDIAKEHKHMDEPIRLMPLQAQIFADAIVKYARNGNGIDAEDIFRALVNALTAVKPIIQLTEEEHMDESVKLEQRQTPLFADDKVVLSYNELALRAEFNSKERMNAFLNLIKEEKCFHIETDFDVDQNVYKLLVKWKE